MANAKKLSSGNWRCRATWVNEKGERKYKSFTAPKKNEAEALALSFLKDIEDFKKPENRTLGQASDVYIEGCSNIFSPSTIVGYKKIRRTALQDIINVKLNRLTLQMYQDAINNYSKDHSYKSVSNAHIFYNKILKENGFNFGDKINLPKKVRKKIDIPETEEVQSFLIAIKDTKIYLYVLFSVCLGLRKSEILGLYWNDIDFDNHTIDIQRALVLDENNNWVEKSPKTESGTRSIFVPNVLLEELKILQKRSNGNKKIFTDSPHTLHNTYYRLSKKVGFNYRFHALRHYYASLLNSEGLPNKYTMERMGHATENMLKQVYQHTMKNKNKEFDIVVDKVMTSIFSNEDTK